MSIYVIAIVDKISNNVFEEDSKLLIYYDQAFARVGDNTGDLA